MSDTGYYEGPLAHTFDELRRLRLRLRARIALERELGRIPPRAEAPERGHVTGDAVDAALELDDRLLVLMERGEPLRWRQATDALDREIETHLERTREVGLALPMRQLIDDFGLSPLAVDILWLAVGAELDGGIRQSIGFLQNDLTRQHPDLELAASLFCEGPRARAMARWELAPDAPLFRFGLLVLPRDHLADDCTVLRMPLRPSRRLVDFLLGDMAVDPVLRRAARIDRCPPGTSPLEWLILSDDERRRFGELVARAGSMARAGQPPVVIVHGPTGVGKSVLAWAIGQQVSRTALRIDIATLPRHAELGLESLWQRIVRESRLQRAMLLVEGAEQCSTEELAEIGRALDRDPGLPVVFESRAPVILSTRRPQLRAECLLPGHAERALMWQRELGRRDLPVSLAGGLAAKYRISGGAIVRSLDELAPEEKTATQLGAALQSRLTGQSEHHLATLATRVTTRSHWDDLIVPDETLIQLQRLAAHFRHRTKLMVDWGFEQVLKTGQGISALFQGPPGTGKTMAAGVIAQEFDMELFQIDLSRIVSKWLGETEKNLATIFDEAEKAHAILLFDEADALFGKRTSVQSSNDRHANLEVNFLLQRMDQFRGITILTTNFGASIDDAFLRRITFRVEFPQPDAVDRAQLWQALLPRPMARDHTVDPVELGRRFEMSGGHIRNAILKAAIQAASEGRPVSMAHLVEAGNAEYRTIGKIVRE